MIDDGEIHYEPVLHRRSRDCQSAASRRGPINRPAWIRAVLVATGALLAAGTVAAGTITVPRTEALLAVTQGRSVAAVRADGTPFEYGTAAQFRDPSGTTQDAVVVEVTANQVRAQLDRPASAGVGELVVPAGRRRLISVLLPKLW